MSKDPLTQKERLARIETSMQSINKRLEEELPLLREDIRHMLAYQNRQRGALAVILTVGGAFMTIGTVVMGTVLKKVFVN